MGLTRQIDQWAEVHRQEGLRQGMQQGMEQGMEAGRFEGRQEGKHEGLQEVLTRQLQRRFGPLSAEITARFQAATSDNLTRWADNILDDTHIEDVFKTH